MCCVVYCTNCVRNQISLIQALLPFAHIRPTGSGFSSAVFSIAFISLRLAVCVRFYDLFELIYCAYQNDFVVAVTHDNIVTVISSDCSNFHNKVNTIGLADRAIKTTTTNLRAELRSRTSAIADTNLVQNQVPCEDLNAVSDRD